MIINGFTIVPNMFVKDRYKINYNLLKRLLKKYPNKKESDFKEGIIYYIPNIKTYLCSYETYHKITKTGDLNGNSSVNLVGHINDFIRSLYSLDSCQTAKHTSSPNGPN
jgi:hypothetical protein